MEKERLDGVNEKVFSMAHKIEDTINTEILRLIDEKVIQRELSIIILRSLSLTMGSYLYQMSGGKKEAFDMGVGLFAEDLDSIYGMLETEAKEKADLMKIAKEMTEARELDGGAKDDLYERGGANPL